MKQIRNFLIIALAFLAQLQLCECAIKCTLKPLANIGDTIKTAMQYYESGDYEREVACVAAQAKEYIAAQCSLPKNAAIVFDIDETALSNITDIFKQWFIKDRAHIQEWQRSEQSAAIKPIRDLYNFAQKRGIKTFFITGRRKSLQPFTERNLIKEGYTNWAGLYTRPDDDKESSLIPYKTAMRKKITDQGYSIITTVGDQESDLRGGYAGKTFKLPNHLYTVP